MFERGAVLLRWISLRDVERWAWQDGRERVRRRQGENGPHGTYSGRPASESVRLSALTGLPVQKSPEGAKLAAWKNEMDGMTYNAICTPTPKSIDRHIF